MLGRAGGFRVGSRLVYLAWGGPRVRERSAWGGLGNIAFVRGMLKVGVECVRQALDLLSLALGKPTLVKTKTKNQGENQTNT